MGIPWKCVLFRDTILKKAKTCSILKFSKKWTDLEASSTIAITYAFPWHMLFSTLYKIR